MKKIFHFFSMLLLFSTLVACTKKQENTGTNPTPTPVPTPTPTPSTLINLPRGWKYSTTLNNGMPSGINVYQFDSIYANRNTKAFCVAFNPTDVTLDFKPIQYSTATTPSSMFQLESGTKYVCMNGGYFGSGQSFSLVEYNNTVTSPNIRAVTRSFNSVNTSYFPTRAAFGITSTGTPAVAWIYNVNTNDNIYSYPNPSNNAEGSAPQAQPTASFPTGGTLWNMNSAIGGSPMLLVNNTVRITATEELISVNNTTSRPRTGIGYTANNLVLMVVVEGDNAPNYPGMNLQEFADFLKNLGCTNAINLDGGGSTSMVINGQQTVRPGDSGIERPVISGLILKRK
jgi:Phosphodiester glycosidase